MAAEQLYQEHPKNSSQITFDTTMTKINIALDTLHPFCPSQGKNQIIQILTRRDFFKVYNRAKNQGMLKLYQFN